jgi:hypothetical protein
MLERLDFKSVRFDKLTDTIVINGKKVIVEISRDAFEALYRQDFTGDEAILKAVEESKRLNHLANVIPADDGKIHITAALMLGNGQFNELRGNKTGE